MATKLTCYPQISGADIYSNSATQLTSLGVYAETNDGRGFRYACAGGSDTVAGQVFQGPAEDTTNYSPSGGLSVAASAIGATTVTLTSSVTIAKNALAGGLLFVNVTPGIGYSYKILSNTAVTGAAGCVFTLEDPLIVALTTSSKITVRANIYNGIVVAPTTMTNSIVGVPQYIVTAAYYGWVQTHGMAACLQTGTGTCGKALGFLQGGTQGSLAPAIAGTPILAWSAGTNITGEYSSVFLTIN